MENLQEIFDSLFLKWQHETKYISSSNLIFLNPNYQQIIGMGNSALPFIFEELQNKNIIKEVVNNIKPQLENQDKIIDILYENSCSVATIQGFLLSENISVEEYLKSIKNKI